MTLGPHAEVTRVGVLGLGRMGEKVARALVGTVETRGWDEVTRDIEGVQQASGAADLMACADVVVSCLPSSRETHGVLLRPDVREAFERSNVVFVDTSTSEPEALPELASRFREDAALRLLDAPILGRPDTCGSWTVPVGGSKAAFERVLPVLERFAERVVWVGALGTGHKIKLLNNLMFAAINVVTAEAFGACDYLDVDRRTFGDLVSASRAATVSPLFRALAPRMSGEELPIVFTVSLLEKDARLAAEMAQRAGVPLRLATHVHDVVREAVERGLGERDSADLVELYEGGGSA